MSSAALEVVPMTQRHLRQVRALDAAAYPKPWSKQLWREELGRPGRHYRVALLDDDVVGHIGAMVAAEEAHIMTVVTDPTHRRSGIASHLLASLVPDMVDAGCTALTLEVRASNKAAQALYRRFGLVPVGVRRGYYEPDGEDAIVMWAHDIHDDDYRDRIFRISAALREAA